MCTSCISRKHSTYVVRRQFTLILYLVMCFSFSEILLIIIVTNCVELSFVDPHFNPHSKHIFSFKPCKILLKL